MHSCAQACALHGKHNRHELLAAVTKVPVASRGLTQLRTVLLTRSQRHGHRQPMTAPRARSLSSPKRATSGNYDGMDNGGKVRDALSKLLPLSRTQLAHVLQRK